MPYKYKTVRQFFHPKHYIDRVSRSGKPVGYCHCAKHRGYLNATLIKSHKCVKKNCRWLEKYNHEYWDKKGRHYEKDTDAICKNI